jgi:hypothetical protein
MQFWNQMEKIGHDDELTYTNFSLYAIIHHEFDDRIRGINVTLPVCVWTRWRNKTTINNYKNVMNDDVWIV